MALQTPQERREHVGVTALTPKAGINGLPLPAAGHRLPIGRAGLFRAQGDDDEFRGSPGTRKPTCRRGAIDCATHQTRVPGVLRTRQMAPDACWTCPGSAAQSGLAAANKATTGAKYCLAQSAFCLGRHSSHTGQQTPQTHQRASSCSNQYHGFRKRKAGH